MKKFYVGALALTAMACLMACDDSSSSSSFEIPTYKSDSALPDSCQMEAAKVGDTYYACAENKWVEVTDSATIEKLKEGLDEDEVKAQVEELLATLSSNSSKKDDKSDAKSSASKDEGSEVTDDSSSSEAEEECTGRRCGDSSSSSKKSSGGSSNSGSGSGSDSPSSTGSSETESSNSGSDTESSNSEESSSSLATFDDVTISVASSLLYGRTTTISVLPADAVSGCVIQVDNKDYEDLLPVGYDCSFDITNNNTGTENVTLTFWMDSFYLYGEELFDNKSKAKTITFYHEGYNFGRYQQFEFLDNYLTWTGSRTTTPTIVYGEFKDGVTAATTQKAVQSEGYECATETSGTGKTLTSIATCTKTIVISKSMEVTLTISIIVKHSILLSPYGDVQTSYVTRML